MGITRIHFLLAIVAGSLMLPVVGAAAGRRILLIRDLGGDVSYLGVESTNATVNMQKNNVDVAAGAGASSSCCNTSSSSSRATKYEEPNSYNANYGRSKRPSKLRRSTSPTLMRSWRMNSIDECWRRATSNWAENRMKLAECAIGFGSKTTGGLGGALYVVTDPSDDPENPAPGTLRYGVIQEAPLWIHFAHDMTITLRNELLLTSDKTIDGRGADVHIAYGPCLTIQYVRNVIVHGLHIHHCKPGRAGKVRSSTSHLGFRQGSDGDGISVFGSTDVWIDHNSLSSCADGLIDVIHASTAVTISNNAFTDHDKVMLLGHNDAYTADKGMQVTVAFNRFGPGLVQRMPRCRFGYFHVVNNDYYDWGMYAVGGSASPTIISEGNRYQASRAKQVTKRDVDQPAFWEAWTWKSIDDTFLDGAYFVESGPPIQKENRYGLGVSSKFQPYMTADAGALDCVVGSPC